MALVQRPTQSQDQFAWWRLRIKKGVSSATSGELDDAIEVYESFEIAFSSVVALGVLIEFFVAFVHPLYDSPRGIWWPVIGDAFVAIGLVVEVLAGVRIKICQSELTERSNKALAAANERLGNLELEAGYASERGATLEKEAAEARHLTAQLLKVTARRQLSVDQVTAIAEAVRGQASQIDLLVEFQSSDSEAFVFAQGFCAAFRRAGVTKIRSFGNAFLSGIVFGVHVAAGGTIDITRLVQVFSASETPLHVGSMDLETHLPRGATPPNLYIFVAPKPPPEIEAAMATIAARGQVVDKTPTAEA